MIASELVFVALYLLLMVLLSAIAVHRFALAYAAWRRAKRPKPPAPAEWPSVLVQVPLYNERYVVERVIDGVCALDYPTDKLSIQILDDSTDGTSAIAAAAVARWAERGIAIEHVRRDNREQYKAGALAAGLTRTDAELVAVFDADFEPPAHMLKELVPEFQDEKVGMVQARWGHSNRDESLLTHTQAILLDGHFANEHGGRFAKGCFFNFNGTAGMWRVKTIADAGGWSGKTLTEDLDLSYRAQLKGWRFVYRDDVEVPGELPTDVRAFKSQQHRWAKGSIQTALVLLGRIVKSDLPFRVRWEASFHLAGNFAYPLVLFLTVLFPFALTVKLELPLWVVMAMDATFFVMSTCSLVAFYLMAERQVGAKPHTRRYLPMVLALGIGMAVNNTRAVVEALMQRESAFNRTPKLGDKKTRGAIDPEYIVQADWQSLVELGFGAYLVGAVVLALSLGRFVAVPFLALFAMGFLFLALGSLWHTPLIGRRASAKAVDSPSHA